VAVWSQHQIQEQTPNNFYPQKLRIELGWCTGITSMTETAGSSLPYGGHFKSYSPAWGETGISRHQWSIPLLLSSSSQILSFSAYPLIFLCQQKFISSIWNTITPLMLYIMLQIFST